MNIGYRDGFLCNISQLYGEGDNQISIIQNDGKELSGKANELIMNFTQTYRRNNELETDGQKIQEYRKDRVNQN